MQSEPDTRARLVMTAARLFQLRGYHGTGLAEILTVANAPKGSLYHHFPNGKPDLALAAADWASEGLVQIIADSFAKANDFAHGATTLCYKLAKFYDISGGVAGCPVTHALFDAPENDAFRAQSQAMLDRWIGAIAAHAERLGLPADRARAQAETLMISIEGAWIVCRTRRSSDVLRGLPTRLFDGLQKFP